MPTKAKGISKSYGSPAKKCQSFKDRELARLANIALEALSY